MSPGPLSPVVGKKHDLFPTPQWHDLWAAILYYIHFRAFLGIGGYALYLSGGNYSQLKKELHVDSNILPFIGIQLAGSLIIGLALTIISFGWMRRNAEQLMHASMLFNAGMWLVIGILVVRNQVWTGVACFIVGLLTLVWYLVIRKRIPFSAVILRMVVDCSNHYPSMFTVVGGSAVVACVYSLVFSLFMASLYAVKDKFRESILNVLLIFMVFSFYWTVQVIANVTQTTIAGIFATYYFTHGTGQRVESATTQSLNRALTYSFGSICFGSLIVAILQTLRYVLRAASGGEQRNLASVIFDCLLGIIEALVRYFNYYAYTQIAIYGKSFIQAAKDTFTLFKERGLDAIVNDDVISTTCTFLVMGIGLASLVFSTCLSFFIYGIEFWNSVIIGFLFGLISAVIAIIAFEVVTSGATATFVCLAEDPAVMQRNNPQLYSEIVAKYGHILA